MHFARSESNQIGNAYDTRDEIVWGYSKTAVCHTTSGLIAGAKSYSGLNGCCCERQLRQTTLPLLWDGVYNPRGSRG